MDIDLNADLGEGYGPWRMGDDEALLGVLSSANVACGFHAGDPLIMDRTVRLAGARGVDVGAHVGFPDRQGFGRRVMQIDTGELAADGHLPARCAGRHRARRGSPHDAHELPRRARQHGRGRRGAGRGCWCARWRDFDPALIVSSSSQRAPSRTRPQRYGLRVATTFLADRAYDDEGLLVPRKLPGSVIHDEAAVLARVRQLLDDGTVTTYGGKTIADAARARSWSTATRPARWRWRATLRGEIESRRRPHRADLAPARMSTTRVGPT